MTLQIPLRNPPRKSSGPWTCLPEVCDSLDESEDQVYDERLGYDEVVIPRYDHAVKARSTNLKQEEYDVCVVGTKLKQEEFDEFCLNVMKGVFTDSEIGETASVAVTLQAADQGRNAELQDVTSLLSGFPDPVEAAWAELQRAYVVEAACWDEDVSVKAPANAVRAKLDLVLMSFPAEHQAIEEAMDVVLEQWDAGMFGASLEKALTAAVFAEATATARLRLLETLEAALANEGGLRAFETPFDPPLEVDALVSQCRLGNPCLEFRIRMALNVTEVCV